jgi:dTDP-4-amino-4,6-dideoxygalactose transaminase
MPGPGYYFVGDEEVREVLEVVRSGHLSRYGEDGDPTFFHKVYTLEQEFAHKMRSGYCVAVSSGTGALMAALVAAGIGPGDEVLVPGYTFVATFSAVIAIGARPVMVEVDESLTMDPQDARRKITPRTRGMIPVHMLGAPCDMAPLTELAAQHNLHLIEDCCQALGGSYRGQMLGTFGELGAFSLNNHKVINSGDGGLVITDSKELYERVFGYHDQGHKPLRKGVEIGSRALIGINLRLNEISGAFALAQLRKLDTILDALRTRKARFKAALEAAHLEGMSFRKLNDPGECATLLTVQFQDQEMTMRAAKSLASKPVIASGWHVYNNMEQILAVIDENGAPLYHKHMLPRTDDILSRSINLSVGVIDPGLGADFGISPISSDEEIDRKAEEFIKLIKPIAG